MQSNYKKLIPKLLFSIIMLSIMGVLLYKNFIKEEKKFFYLSDDMGIESSSARLNFDFFDNEIFKSLIKVEEVDIPTSEQLGRENPFLKF